MKKIILTALAVATIQFTQAQEAKTSEPAVKLANPERQAPTAEQVATRQSEHLQKILTLTEDQKQKVYSVVLKRAATILEMKSKSTNRESFKTQANAVKEQGIKDINAILSPEQQKKWADFRLQQKQKQEARKNQQTNPNGTAPPTKLEPSDDGMKD